MENVKRDLLLERMQLYRNEDLTFRGFDGLTEKEVIGFYNTGKRNPKEPDLRLYTFTDFIKGNREELLSLWVKESEKGVKFLIGNAGGRCYIGLIHFNRLEASDPYLTIYAVVKTKNFN